MTAQPSQARGARATAPPPAVPSPAVPSPAAPPPAVPSPAVPARAVAAQTAPPSGGARALPGPEDLRSLLTIRHFENLLLRMFTEGRLNGTTHTCLGQEHVPVSLAPLLAGDHVLSNHRGHGHYLALFRDPAGLLAEITGREGAVCSGVGGSQHIRRDGYLSTGVQGQSLPLAVGIALRCKRTGSGRIAAVFVGDGTWGEGAVYEALNMAALWRVPVLVVVEHNGIAQSTPTSLQMAGSVADRAAAFGIDFLEVTGHHVSDIRERLAPVVRRVREEHRPAVVQFTTHRLGPHSKGDDTRDPAEVELLRAGDWYARYAGLADRTGEAFRDLDARVRAELDALAREVQARPPAARRGPGRPRPRTEERWPN
ncbi:dehydrogenase, E1 component, alpha and beta subunit [Streptomyces zinciresistens K42]|uniref:Dehydrogenase, E1 component, alpha and beta subunit n=1 Tax=Streptomyces zinciresistens K42 TaxID=700597 RepID=G2GE76_9ACTN|nr:thiamine pyrophosphate-dependent dehydrogenase E1 component subunit alpha [Streptomyces zinciresistens]EGX58209.1 dehydrogenase, E1 component, alpha and beta subunit [Streptomyces zinciresistens K42]